MFWIANEKVIMKLSVRHPPRREAPRGVPLNVIARPSKFPDGFAHIPMRTGMTIGALLVRAKRKPAMTSVKLFFT
jgi:hypothetical protein